MNTLFTLTKEATPLAGFPETLAFDNDASEVLTAGTNASAGLDNWAGVGLLLRLSNTDLQELSAFTKRRINSFDLRQIAGGSRCCLRTNSAESRCRDNNGEPSSKHGRLARRYEARTMA